jgi:hypothetical protein
MNHLLSQGLYVALLGFLNHVRGGYLNKFWDKPIVWKIVAALLVGVCSWSVLTLGPIYGLALGVLWYAFMLPPWASWFDMGLLPSDLQRDNGILNLPYRLVNATFASQKVVDVIMMTLRGLVSVVIFAPIAYVRHDWWLAALALPCAVSWMFAYAVDRWWIKLNWAEYLAGVVIGLFIVLALAI